MSFIKDYATIYLLGFPTCCYKDLIKNMYDIYKLQDFDKKQFFSIGKTCFGQHHLIHFHDSVEISILMEGSGIHYLNGIEYYVKKNSIAIISTNDYHAMYNLTSNNVIYNILINPAILNKDLLAQIEKISSPKIYQMTEEESKSIINLMDLIDLTKNQKLPNEFYTNLISNLVLLFFNGFNPNIQNTIKQEQNPFQKCISYINNHFHDNFTLQDIAKFSGYSLNYLSLLFHKNTHVTFKQYLTTTRLIYAKKLLETTDKPIQEICFDCGFASTASFLRNFKQNENCTPTEYRTKVKKTNLSSKA